MVVYVVTGAARGLGYEFLRQLSQDPSNLVFGLVRNKEETEKKVAADGFKNVHIIQASVTDRKALQAARAEIEQKTPVVDVLINNAALMPPNTYFAGLADFEDSPELLDEDLMSSFETNAVGVVKVTNTFLPLVKKSSIKKVIAISSGMADDSLATIYDVYEGSAYAMSKAALNTAIARYAARYGKSTDGIFFLSLSPGLVDTGNSAAPPPNSELPQKFAKAYPHFAGPITPEVSVKAMMSVVNGADASSEIAGGFVSHFGNKQWL